MVVAFFSGTTGNISIGFVRVHRNFIQAICGSMQIVCDCIEILALDLDQTFALKNIEEVFEFINGIMRHVEKIIQDCKILLESEIEHVYHSV